MNIVRTRRIVITGHALRRRDIDQCLENTFRSTTHIFVCVCVNIRVCTQRNDKYVNMHINIQTFILARIKKHTHIFHQYVVCLYFHQYKHATTYIYIYIYIYIYRGGGMYKGGGPWPPQNFEIFFKYIYNYFNIFKI